LLSHPETGIADIARIWPEFLELPAAIAAQLETDAKYAVYLERQAADVAAFRRDESFELPEQLDYAAVPGLSNESRQKVAAVRPRTLGHAGRIDGLTPAALTLLAAFVRRGRFGGAKLPSPACTERDLALAPFHVSRETSQRLSRFVELLLERQRHTNLIA